MGNVSLIDGHFDNCNDEVFCKDCEYLIFSDMYGECSKSYKGIVFPNDCCGKGIRKDDKNV